MKIGITRFAELLDRVAFAAMWILFAVALLMMACAAALPMLAT